MKGLLTTVLEEAKRKKVMFRYSALDRYSVGDHEDIDDWGYDIKRVIEMLNGFSGGYVEFLQSKHVNKDNKKIVNMKRLKSDLQGYYWHELQKNPSISYSCEPEFEQYGITIGEGDLESITSIDEEEAVEYLFECDGYFEYEFQNITGHIQDSPIKPIWQSEELKKVFDIDAINNQWLDDLHSLVYMVEMEVK